MTEDILHTIDFHLREDYIEDDYSVPLHSVSASTKLPTPNAGDWVSFGWHEKDGERVDRVNMHEAGRSDSDVSYGKSDEYEVIAVDHHYHHARKTNSDGGRLVTNRIEVSTTVAVIEAEQ